MPPPLPNTPSYNTYTKLIYEFSVTQFTNKDVVSLVLDLANRYHNDSMEGNRLAGGMLKRHILALVFYEPSTRTLNSFDSAMKRLDGKTTILNAPHSSIQKGESLEDTIQMMAAYSDAIVLRHPEVGVNLERVEDMICILYSTSRSTHTRRRSPSAESRSSMPATGLVRKRH